MVHVPMLFVSGDRDALAQVNLLESVVRNLGQRAALCLIKDGDHGLRVPAKSGRTSADAQTEALDAIDAWIEARQ
jgi:predicted alpha/beta-hydrolase family hydrolase